MPQEPKTVDVRHFGKLSRDGAVDAARRHCRDTPGIAWLIAGDTIVHLPDGRSARSFVHVGAKPAAPEETAPEGQTEPEPETFTEHDYRVFNSAAFVKTALSKMNTAKLRAFAKEFGKEVKFSRDMKIAEKRQIVLDAWRASQ